MLSSRQERAQPPSQEAKGTSIKDQPYVAAAAAVLVTAGGTRVQPTVPALLATRTRWQAPRAEITLDPGVLLPHGGQRAKKRRVRLLSST